jgi:hypothetical protein
MRPPINKCVICLPGEQGGRACCESLQNTLRADGSMCGQTNKTLFIADHGLMLPRLRALFGW